MKKGQILQAALAVGMSVVLTFTLVNIAKGSPSGWGCSFRRYMWVDNTPLDPHISCGTCHTDFIGDTITPADQKLNAYGADLKTLFYQALNGQVGLCEHEIMDAIGQADSDGDGYNNLYEISALSFPGYSDSNCPPEADGACIPVANPGDMDYDGVPAADDCNDYAATAPGTEACDGIDNNCDGTIDEGFDEDGDGYTICELDCNDRRGGENIHPGATELCDGVDNDCDGVIDEDCPCTGTDNDGDGYYTTYGCGTEIDCDDTNPDIKPGATEICDGVDNNCNNLIDEFLLHTYYRDADGDSYGNVLDSVQSCDTTPPSGYVNPGLPSDCNDNNPSINPGALEVCDGVDNNCDGQIDEGVTSTFYQDSDNDGYGNGIVSVDACSAPAGYVSDSTDCDDTDAGINPAACDIKNNGIDEDCDGVDRTKGQPCSSGGDPEICDDGVDNDGDGYIDCADTDCIGDPACSGGCVPSPEICDDGIDNDCDGKADCLDRKDCKNFPGC